MMLAALLLLAALSTAAAQLNLEELVERFHLGAKVTLAENASCLEADQQAWQRTLKACKDPACVKRAQLERLATLQALQESVPGGLDLPEVPQLLWAISPAGEAKSGGVPLQVEGRLAYSGGYYLREDSGKSTLLVDDLSLRGTTSARMAEIRAASRDARLMARGMLAAAPGFDPRNCVFLYVLP
jgi:hypothetical protein